MIERMQANFLKKITIFLGIVWIILFPLATSSQTSVWGKPALQAILWADGKPNSRFAQAYAAGFLESIGEYDEAFKYYKHMVVAFPANTGPYALWLSVACQQDDKSKFPDMNEVLKNFRTQPTDTATVSSIRIIFQRRAIGKCNLSHDTLIAILDALTQNPDSAYKIHFYYAYAMFYAMQGQYGKALEKLNKSGDTPQIRMQRIAWLTVERRFDEALFHVNKARKELNPLSLRLYTQDLNDFEKLINSRKNQSLPIKDK